MLAGGFCCLFLEKTPEETDCTQFQQMFLNMSHALRTNMNTTDGANLMSSLYRYALKVVDEMAHNPGQHGFAAGHAAAPAPVTVTATVSDYSKTAEIYDW
jgi:hypothetical protein